MPDSEYRETGKLWEVSGMNVALDIQYKHTNARIRHLRGAETLLSMNFLAIHRLLEFNEYLGESAGEFQKIRIGRCG